jgi:hypothetical protein
LQSPQPGFNRFSQICREAHRRGKPELLMDAVQRLVPVRTASGEDLRFLLRAFEGLISAMIQAGQAIVKLSGQKESALLELMRKRLKEAWEAMARFAPRGKTNDPG